MKTINASYFKARCLAILDRVRETGERIVAELWPPSQAESQYPQSELEGTVTVIGNIVGPVVPEDHWDSLADVGSTPDRTGGETPRAQSDRMDSE